MNLKQCDNFIASCVSWDEFYEKASQMDNKVKGDVFERLTQLYLKTCPEYASILKEVWWQGENLPKNLQKKLALPDHDEGIDLIAETYSGEYWAIQCKFRTDQSKALTYKELSTFSSLSFVTCNNISLALVVHTSTKPVKKRNLLPDMTEVGLDRWLELSDEDWERITAQCMHKNVKLIKRKPRPHQEEAIQDAKEHFVSERQSRGKLIMPCGTGKSLTAFWIAEALKAKTIIVAVPSLALVRQSLSDWTREFLAHGIIPEWYCFCSDESTGKLDADEFVGSTYDLGIPADTSKEKVGKFLRKLNKGKKIIFTTYQSGPKLCEIVNEVGCKFDLGIFDEAHKTVGDKSKAFATLLFNENIPINKRLFMTATERVLRGRNDDVLSMDDLRIYGDCFHLLTFKQAINQKLISDYKIVTMTVTTSQIEEVIAKNGLLSIGTSDAEALMLAAGISLRKVFQKHNVHHAISFHSSIKKADNFRKQQDMLNTIKELGVKSDNFHISSKKSTGQRANLLKEFTAAESAVITNARCLTEGVDIPAIDCVLFADPKQSLVDIVQASGRALRNFEGKDFGYIVLPLVVPEDMEFDEFTKQTAFKNVARVITSLSIQDERIAEEFRVIHSGGVSGGKIIEIEPNVALGMKMEAAEFAEAISLKVWKNVGRANWRPFDEARSFAHSLKLSNQSEWEELAKSGILPEDIPYNVKGIYKDKGWMGFGDWLNTGNIAPRDRIFKTYREARAYAQSLKLSSKNEWVEYTKSGRLPEDIPIDPAKTYKDSGWINWGDWLGTGEVATFKRTYRPFSEARSFVQDLEISSQSKWREYAKTHYRPVDIPADPYGQYKGKGWINWGDWLGTGTKGPRDFKWRPFREARAYAQSLKLSSSHNWKEFVKSGRLPEDIPASPSGVFKGKGWINWGDWLGTGTKGPRDFKWRPFREARAYAQSLKLSSKNEWVEYTKSGRLPEDIPAGPSRVFKGKGWINWGDWLGTGVVAPQSKEYRSFEKARDFARELKLSRWREWSEFAKSGSLPADIPSCPNHVYKSKGWKSMRDWLGTE